MIRCDFNFSLISADSKHGSIKAFLYLSNVFQCDGLLRTTTAQSDVRIESQKWILYSCRNDDVHSSNGIFLFQSQIGVRIFGQLLRINHSDQYDGLLFDISAQNGINPQSD